MSTEPNKIIYSMVGVSKFYDKKPVLKDIYLSYFYGAKIGVIGLNGSGKSSLLRILAGVDKDFNGETVISPGFHRRLSRTGAADRRCAYRSRGRRRSSAGNCRAAERV